MIRESTQDKVLSVFAKKSILNLYYERYKFKRFYLSFMLLLIIYKYSKDWNGVSLRLREMDQLIEEYNKALFVTYESNPRVTNGVIRLQKIQLIDENMRKLRELGYIQSEYSEYRKIVRNKYHVGLDELPIDMETQKKLGDIFENVREKNSAVRAAIKKAIADEKENSLSVRLPDYIKLDAISKFIDDLNKTFRLILPIQDAEKAKVNSFDSGSNWIEMALVNADNIIVVAEFFTSVVNLTTEIIKNKRLEPPVVSEVTMPDELQEGIKTYIKNLNRAHIQKAVDEYLEDHPYLKDIQEEDKTALANRMAVMSKYVEDGAKVIPALNAPPEEKEKFPNSEMYSQVKELNKTLLLTHVDKEQEELD